MRVLIEGTNTPTIYKFDGQAAVLRIEAIKGFTTVDGQTIPPSSGNEQDFYLEIPLTIANDELLIPSFEIDSTEDAYPWDSTVTGDVPGYRSYFKLANGRRIPYIPKFKVPTLEEGDPSLNWGEIRIFNRAFRQRYAALDRVINVNMAQEWIQNAVGQLNRASETNRGITALDVDPVDPTFPIAVGVNSPLLSGGSGSGSDISVLDHGGAADAVVIEDATISLGTPNTLTSIAGGFTSSLIGKVIAIAGAGAGGATLITTITGVPDTDEITIATAATTAVTNTRAVHGTDNTAAWQAALDAAAVSEETSTVYAPPGNYLFVTGSLNVPQGVRLQGSWELAPYHLGYRYTNEQKPTSGRGTTMVVVAGEGTATGSFIFLNSLSALRGVSIFYPAELATLTTPKLYPWAIEMFGAGTVVENVELVNPYQGIYSHIGHRHRVYNVVGLPLLTGLYASQQLATSTYSHISFGPVYTFAIPEAPPYNMSPLMQWVHQNGTAFKLGRTDNAIFYECDTYAYLKGFKFVVDAPETTTFANGTGAPGGKAWAHFHACAADTCSYPAEVDDSQDAGITFTDSGFSASQWFAFAGPPLNGFHVRSTNTGRVALIDCQLNLGNRLVMIEAGKVSITGGYFVSWNVNAIAATAGVISVTGTVFKGGSPTPISAANVWLSVTGNTFEYPESSVYSITNSTFGNKGNAYNDSPIWAAAAFQNGWANIGGGYQPVTFIKEDATVYLRGVMGGGTLGATAFQLPAGYRPPAHLLLATTSNGAFAFFQVDSSGVVTPGAGASNVSFAFNHRFDVR